MKGSDDSQGKISQRLSPLFERILEVPEFTTDLNMGGVDTWDSLAHIRLLAAIEETFGIEIAFEDAVEMITGTAIVAKIAKYLRGPNRKTMSQLRPHQQLQIPLDMPYGNVVALFTAKVEQYPDKTFLIFPGKNEEAFSYRSFDERYEGAARFLRHLGLSRGDRFTIVFPNCAEFLFFYFAGLSLGITVVPINPDLSPREMAYIVTDSCARAVLYHKPLSAKCSELRNLVSAAVTFRSIDGFADMMVSDGADDLRSSTATNIGLGDEAVIIYTSGTTGNPKGVVLSHQNLLADAKAICEWFQFSPNTRALTILPLFHNNGQVTTLLAPLFAGGSAVIVRGKASLLSFWGLVAQYEVTFTSVMASILAILSNSHTERRDNSLLAILCGGQVLTRSVQDEFERRSRVPVFEGFGLTETTSFSCINDYPKEVRRIGSIGRPLPVNEMTILDENDQVLGPGCEGQICIRGYNVAIEYLGMPERNATSFANGWFHSGDFGTRDEDGYFYFLGRKDSLIIKGGENIYPAELENVIYQHPAVAECAVVGIPDKLLGEDLCAFVKRVHGMQITERELKDFCKGKIAPYKQAKRVVMIDDLPDLAEIPKGPTKKVLYRVLRDYYEQHLSGAA